MPLPEFVQRVRNAMSWVAPEVRRGGRPDVQDDYLAQQLSRQAFWLVPATIEFYDPGDFDRLHADQQHRLADAVGRFRRVVEAVPEGTRPTREQYSTGLEAFDEITDLLEPYLGTEGQEVFRALWAVQRDPALGFHDWITGFDFELRADESGDPIAAVWVVVPDDLTPAPGSPEFARRTHEVEEAVRRKFDACGIHRWPYVLVRTVSDQRDEQSAETAAS